MEQGYFLSPQKDWEANEPERLSKTLSVLKTISSEVGIEFSRYNYFSR